ncbi:MAG: SMI1/KNR4 family protein [Rhodanobacter sp.]|jgi:hypothetical protein|nr:SMI1/KNR4 family protein [Rhodanobacter sp.]
MSAESVVDTFVARLRGSGADLCQVDAVPWIAEIEQRFGFSYPSSFRALVTRYIFEPLEIGPVEIFANLGDGSTEDLTVAPFSDPYMSPWLLAHRLVQFGRPSTGSYNPVCFDFADGPTEPTIVLLDHEDILQEHTPVHRKVIARDFLSLLEAVKGA